MVNDPTEDEVRERLRVVLEFGREADLDIWAATGRLGCETLRELFSGRLRLDSATGRDAVDNLVAATRTLAGRHPNAFLETFASASFDRNGYVIHGFGAIDDERATRRLVQAVQEADWVLRVDAAIGLRGRAAPAAIAALIGLLADPEYLVRYHALRSLEGRREERVLAALRAFEPSNDVEHRLVSGLLERAEHPESSSP